MRYPSSAYSGSRISISVVHTGCDGIMPEFSIIEKTVTVPGKNDNIFFVLKNVMTLNYQTHFHAYRVRLLNQGFTKVMRQTELTTFRPMHVCKSTGDERSLYVYPKNDVDVYNEQL